jgi:S1-C subfamily serine protease
MRKFALIGAFVAFGAAVLWWTSQQMTPPPLPGPPLSTPIAQIPPAASASSRGLPTLAPMLRQVMPAVVSITVQARAPVEDNPLYKDPFYRRYFGDELPTERKSLSAGSGVVIDAERGLVLTNNHVVRNAEVAQIVGIPAGTVKTRMFRARSRIAELLAEAELDEFQDC